MRTRLTERDLSRIVRRVIYEETPVNDGEDWSQDNYVFTARYEENNDPEHTDLYWPMPRGKKGTWEESEGKVILKIKGDDGKDVIVGKII